MVSSDIVKDSEKEKNLVNEDEDDGPWGEEDRKEEEDDEEGNDLWE